VLGTCPYEIIRRTKANKHKRHLVHKTKGVPVYRYRWASLFSPLENG
jgi:hypothetical protein